MIKKYKVSATIISFTPGIFIEADICRDDRLNEIKVKVKLQTPTPLKYHQTYDTDSSFRFASFGMTTFVFWIGERRERRCRRSLLSPINPNKSLSFRALARNLNLKLLDLVVTTVGVQKIGYIRRLEEE